MSDQPAGPAGIIIVDAHGLNWPKGKPVAVLFNSTGDPWVDLDGWRLASTIASGHDLPTFVVTAPVFPSPEEQQARWAAIKTATDPEARRLMAAAKVLKDINGRSERSAMSIAERVLAAADQASHHTEETGP
ncbi:MAG: hypothetical protein ACTHQQ_12835 [Solirubrobacteraceae bacterium]